jgi:broad specificity phosphatase PhoE
LKLIFIRHAESETNPQNLVPKIGAPVHLSEKGKEQARLLVSVMRNHRVELIYSSLEIRAKETAEIIAKGLGIRVKVLEGLGERNFGEWAGQTWDKIVAVLNKMEIEERYTYIPAGGESWQQMEERSKETLGVITAGKEKCVALVTHQAVLRALMPVLKNEPKESSLKYDFPNASVTIFDFEKGKWNFLRK